MSENKNRMFGFVSDTWNPVTGCLHDCCYCWARDFAYENLANNLNVKHYLEHGFSPAVNENQFKRGFKPDTLVFVCDMGELFGKWVPVKWIRRVIEYTHNYPDTQFLYLTKNPKRYSDFIDLFTDNSILGATIETNRESIRQVVSLAPDPIDRYVAIRKLDWDRKFVSVEPILSFDRDILLGWLRDIHPEMVAVGYDNYGNKLPEPCLAMTEEFIERVQKFSNVCLKTVQPAWWEVIQYEPEQTTI